MEKTLGLFSKNRMLQIAILLFSILTISWLFTKPLESGVMVVAKYSWSTAYALMSFFGAFCSFFISKKWGGINSIVGKILLSFAIGLFLQAFGQTVYSYYAWMYHLEAPYPSIGDIGYFGSIFLYIYGSFLLAKHIGINVSARSFFSKLATVLIPVVMVSISYYAFLGEYQFHEFNLLKISLDFGYPIGQAIYVSFALLILILSHKSYNGVLRKPVLFLVLALILQYIADSYFIFTANNGTWYLGGVGDYLYLLAYFVLTITIIFLSSTLERVETENSSANAATADKVNSTDEQILNQILVEVIKRQVSIMGAMAWVEVRKIPDILVHDEANFKLTIAGDPKNTVDKLVRRYKKVFGDLAVVVSKSAVYGLLRELHPDKTPDILK